MMTDVLLIITEDQARTEPITDGSRQFLGRAAGPLWPSQDEPPPPPAHHRCLWLHGRQSPAISICLGRWWRGDSQPGLITHSLGRTRVEHVPVTQHDLSWPPDLSHLPAISRPFIKTKQYPLILSDRTQSVSVVDPLLATLLCNHDLLPSPDWIIFSDILLRAESTGVERRVVCTVI